MKKKTASRIDKAKGSVCILLLCTALSGTACGSDAAQDKDQSPAQNATVDNQEPQQAENNIQNKDEMQNENELHSDGNDSQENKNDSFGPEYDTTVTSIDSNISIEMHSESEDQSADDGTVYFTKGYAYPTVTIEGNNAAADKINADIRSRIDAFKADTETGEWAKNAYDEMNSYGETTNEPEYSFLAYSEGLIFATERSDSNVISFTVTYTSFTGGAHGNYSTQGINYNSKTGDVIAFSDLSEDPAAFHEDTLDYNQKLAKTEYYQSQMYSPDLDFGGTLESVLYADDVWYLSTTGLVFMSEPYALGPFAAGTIEFIIPYDDLADMGFNQAYTYTDRTIRKVLENETCQTDLNGDGQEDSILFYTDYDSNEDDAASELVFHLLINEIDLSENLNDTMKSLSGTYYWGALNLYDLNVEDHYLDLALLTQVWENENNTLYTYLYRYTKDGSLIYLGRTEGDINDPTVEVAWEEQP